MARNWKDLGEVLSKRDLAVDERVTLCVFDKAAKTLLEKIAFRPRSQCREQLIWPGDFCRHINTRSALIRAGVESASGEWEVLLSNYQNHYWNVCSRELQVVTTVPHWENWSTDKRVQICTTKTLVAGSVVRVNVRSATGALLEGLTFTPSPTRLTSGLWTKDLCIHINNTSFLVRAGRKNDQTIEPHWEDNTNYIWIPKNAGLSVTWSIDELKDAGKIPADRDALDNERISLFVFDSLADKLLDRISLTAKAEKNRLKKEQWPADLARQINASSAHVKAGERSGSTFSPKDSASANVLCQRQGELRIFTTALHLDNWVQGDTLLARSDLKAAERIVVTVSSEGKGNFCEALTFTPDSARLTAKEWAHDLAAYINRYSLYLKAGVKNATNKLIEPQENASSNLIWLPKGSGLKVSWDKHELKELGNISLERDLRVNEGGKAFVLNDSTEEILREISFSAAEGRATRGYACKDFAIRINQQTQLVAAGEKKANERPAPVASSFLNTLWGCAKNVRVFTTLKNLKNWDKGELIGTRDLVEDEQVVVIVKGRNSGRILESQVFTPQPGRMSKGLWSKDLCLNLNSKSRYIRGGEGNTTSCQIEPMHKAEVNYFWTPKGAKLDIEWQIISGIPLDWPGMTSEAKALFDQYAQARKCISVDARTGQASLQIPVAELFADDSLSNGLKVSLAHDEKDGIYIKLGGGSRRLLRLSKEKSQQFALTIRDGRCIVVDLKIKSSNLGDCRIEPVEEYVYEDDLLITARKETTGLQVIYKDGMVEEFSFGLLASNRTTFDVLRLVKCTFPSGKLLEFSYGEFGQLKGILRGDESLVKVEWYEEVSILSAGKKKSVDFLAPSSVVVFPDRTNEKLTFSFKRNSKSELQGKFEVDGFASSGKTSYIVSQNGSGSLTGIDIEHQYGFTVEGKSTTDKALYRETLTYTADGKVDRHVICPGGDMDDLVHDYSYARDSTRLIGYYRKATPRTAFVRTYRFSAGQAYFEAHGSEAAPICRQSAHRLDENNKWLVSEATNWEGNSVVDKQTLAIDAIGDVVSRTENDLITYWTYYNNYQQFKVTETKVKVEDWSICGFLFKSVDYINPVGVGFMIGGSAGMTWGTRIDTKVEMLPASNDYAKKAFNLPVEIVHFGCVRPLSGDVESELVCRLIDGKEVAQRLSFFGYAKVNGKVLTKHKLTILQPDCTKVSVVAEQLAVARAAAAKFIESLEKQIEQSKDDERKAYEQAKKDLEASLDAQSKVNGEGYKLNSWKSASMSLETYDYHTDKSKPGLGTLKSVETVLLDEKGKVVEASRRTTTYAYAVDSTDSSRLTITTTVSSKGQTDIVSSQTRSRNTGRLYERVDSEGVKTTSTYDPQGNLTSEIVSQGNTTLRKTNVTLNRGMRFYFDQYENGSVTRLVRDSLGRKVKVRYRPKGSTDFVDPQIWTYDSLGRVIESLENDFGKDNEKIAQRQTTWTYDDLTGRVSLSHVLKDAAGKALKTVSQSRMPSLRGERFSQGTFSVDRQYDSDAGTLNERYATTGSGGCRIERRVGKDGLTKQVRYLKVDKAGKESEQDKVVFAYDKYGQLSTATPTLGAASTYTYDSAGRLLSTCRDGVVLSNTYDAASLAAVSGESQVKDGDKGVVLSLGKQTVDMLGRASSQTVSAHKTVYSYSGASNKATFKSPGAAPTPISGYSSTIDEKTRTHTQTIDSQSSTLVFSIGGRVLSFTDLTGETTTYEYDFFNRVVGSKNAQCVCTFTYADNGLLSSETIKAVKASNLMMTVSYSYDELGQEIKRTFTCAGVDTLSLERTLLADGRLSKNVLRSTATVKDKAVETERYSDSYEYDQSLRLIKWVGKSAIGGNLNHKCEWSYDALGNLKTLGSPGTWLNESHRYGFFLDPANEGAVTDIWYGEEGVAIPKEPIGCRTVTHDSAGRLTEDGQRTITYHGNGQVNALKESSGSTYTFSYDSDGRVRGGTLDKETDTYHYRADSVYALVQVDKGKSDGFSKRTLVLRNESRACLMQDAITDGKTTRTFELRDANGTVFASVDLATKVITYYRYSPYGKCFLYTNAETWLGFKGEPLNRLGLYYLGNGYRLYDPELGRFLTRDSRSPFGVGGAGGYVFCNGDPVNYADPNGHQVIAQYSRWENTPVIQSTPFRIVVGAVGVLLAPFTAGTSILLAIATTALSFALDMAALIVAESDPQLSRTLEAWGQVFGLASAAAGIAMTVNALKTMPRLRGLLRSRGGPAHPTPIKWPKTPNELRLAQQGRTKALNQLIQGIDEAKAGGTYDAFKAAHLNPGTTSVGGFLPGLPAGARLSQRAGHTTKGLYKGIVRQFDDALFDALGTTLDLYTGPLGLAQRFLPAPESETEVVSIVAGPLPGREKLFP